MIKEWDNLKSDQEKKKDKESFLKILIIQWWFKLPKFESNEDNMKRLHSARETDSIQMFNPVTKH